MTREQVNALRAAGIQDKVIIDLIINETAEAVTPDPEPAPQPEPEKTPEPEKKPEPDKTPEKPTAAADPEPAREDKILAAIEKLTGAIYNHNVLGSGTEDEKKESAADIIGKALRNN